MDPAPLQGPEGASKDPVVQPNGKSEPLQIVNPEVLEAIVVTTDRPLERRQTAVTPLPELEQTPDRENGKEVSGRQGVLEPDAGLLEIPVRRPRLTAAPAESDLTGTNNFLLAQDESKVPIENSNFRNKEIAGSKDDSALKTNVNKNKRGGPDQTPTEMRPEKATKLRRVPKRKIFGAGKDNSAKLDSERKVKGPKKEAVGKSRERKGKTPGFGQFAKEAKPVKRPESNPRAEAKKRIRLSLIKPNAELVRPYVFKHERRINKPASEVLGRKDRLKRRLRVFSVEIKSSRKLVKKVEKRSGDFIPPRFAHEKRRKFIQKTILSTSGHRETAARPIRTRKGTENQVRQANKERKPGVAELRSSTIRRLKNDESNLEAFNKELSSAKTRRVRKPKNGYAGRPYFLRFQKEETALEEVSRQVKTPFLDLRAIATLMYCIILVLTVNFQELPANVI